MWQEIIAGRADIDTRLDKAIRRLLPQWTLGHVYASLRLGNVTINRRKARPNYRLAEGDTIAIKLADNEALSTSLSTDAAQTPEIEKIASQLDVISHDDEVIAINKPRGILVHGANSLTDQVQAYIETAEPHRANKNALTFRSGPLHRIDRNTSGIVLFSASLAGARRYSQLFREHKIDKYYLALLRGTVSGRARWNDLLQRDNIKGASAVTTRGQIANTEIVPLLDMKTTEGSATLCLCRIITGRTHQIRAQAAHHKHPLLGDRKYGGYNKLRQYHYLLHAVALRVPSATSQGRKKLLFAPPPDNFSDRLHPLFGPKIFKLFQRLPRTIVNWSRI